MLNTGPDAPVMQPAVEPSAENDFVRHAVSQHELPVAQTSSSDVVSADTVIKPVQPAPVAPRQVAIAEVKPEHPPRPKRALNDPREVKRREREAKLRAEGVMPPSGQS